jgi:cytochrome c oxidase subunit 3
MGAHGSYYVPDASRWSILGCVGLVTLVSGIGLWLNSHWMGPYVSLVGFFLFCVTLFGWLGEVIHESESGLYDMQVDRSFRMGMTWFIFSEVCFFGAFFGALFFSRFWSIPVLSGDLHPITHFVSWPDFKAHWPLLMNPDNTKFAGAHEAMGPWGLAAINTLILLTSGVTITWAHHALKHEKRGQLVVGMLLTVMLGVIFLCCQAFEYHEAYTEMGLTLNAGIYGTTFFMLTGFHGLHVTIGTIMLIIILIRCIKGHFTPDRHFGFEGVAWYWHFVDVVWLFLFIFVYWI